MKRIKSTSGLGAGPSTRGTAPVTELPPTPISLEAQPVILDDDMDPEQLQQQLEAFFEDSTEDVEPSTFTELLLGSWDGFDMASTLFSVDPTVDIAIAGAALHNTTETVRPRSNVPVADIVAQFREAHASGM
jgi:hypothetical protein